MVALAAVTYVALALQYSASSPLLGLRPDEQWHLGYVEYVQKHRALPVVDLGKRGLEGRPRWEPEGIQPPPSYWLVTLIAPDANLDDIDQLYTPNPHLRPFLTIWPQQQFAQWRSGSWPGSSGALFRSGGRGCLAS